MVTKVIALVHSYRALLPIINKFASLDNAVGLPKYPTTMHPCIHEDNAGALILAETLSPHYKTQSKYCAIMTI